jgi:hypothetical protein
LLVQGNAPVSINTTNGGSTIDGGSVAFATGSGFGQLDFWGNLNWISGTLYVRINGMQGTQPGMNNADLIYVVGNVSVDQADGATLNVTVEGQLAASQTWKIIFATGTYSDSPFPNFVAPPGLREYPTADGLYLDS